MSMEELTPDEWDALRKRAETDAGLRALLAHADALQETITCTEHEVSEVYCYITDNRFSKPNTSACYIIAEFDKAIQDAVEKANEPYEIDYSYIARAEKAASNAPYFELTPEQKKIQDAIRTRPRYLLSLDE